MADFPENWLNPHPMHQFSSVPTVPPPPPLHPPTYVNCPLPMAREHYQTVMTIRRQFQPALPPHQYPPALQPLPPPVNSLPRENVLPRWNVPPIRRQTLPAVQPPYPPALQPRPPPPTVNYDKTTILIKNIPFSYNHQWMIQFLDYFCLQENVNAENTHLFAYDYLYLPYDNRNNKIKGYAIVNFTDKRSLRKFIWSFCDGQKVFPGSKRHVVFAIAHVQGKNALLNTYRYAPEAISFNPPRNGY
ncbi:hypothetical protein EJD97_022771 [Solanum chilense]|uniref:Mei2-like C-terminal RNA recognition motif domain-containing protein n=1 Tax=Solanum chilense TaxID=4083 RepID=A0A6N2ATE2_SOLCI|nr:hypothetical protein EJD97_022771 [Solanum chilense]